MVMNSRWAIVGVVVAAMTPLPGCSQDTGSNAGAGQQLAAVGGAAGAGDTATVGSYAVGLRIGGNLQDQFNGLLQTEAVLRGLRDGLAGDPAAYPPDVAETALMDLQRLASASMAADRAARGADIARSSREFLQTNGQRPGVITTASGLQYQVLTQGTGPKPGPTDSVTTHYHGSLPDGTVFDSSVDRGQPASFPVNGVIAGWQEALQLMPVGSKYRLFVPAALAYGDRGAGRDILPGQALIFDVELISIN